MPKVTAPYKDGSELTFVAGEDIEHGQRVYIDGSGELRVAGADRLADGICWRGDYASGERALMRRMDEGTTNMIASAAIANGAYVYSAANGRVTSVANNYREGRALKAASAGGNIIEAIGLQQDLS